MIFLTNNDKPGVIGRMGTVLGQSAVNIAGMYLGRERQGGQALALILVDSPVRSEVMDLVRGIENVTSARLIRI